MITLLGKLKLTVLIEIDGNSAKEIVRLLGDYIITASDIYWRGFNSSIFQEKID